MEEFMKMTSPSENNLLDDEDEAKTLIKSLVNGKGLEAAVGRVSQRLKVVERSLLAAEKRIEDIPSLYVTVDHFQAHVVATTDTFSEQGTHLKSLSDGLKTLSDEVREDLRARMRELGKALEASEVSMQQMIERTKVVENRSAAYKDEILAELHSLRSTSSELAFVSMPQMRKLEEEVRQSFVGAMASLRSLEERLPALVHQVVERDLFTDEALDKGTPRIEEDEEAALNLLRASSSLSVVRTESRLGPPATPRGSITPRDMKVLRLGSSSRLGSPQDASVQKSNKSHLQEAMLRLISDRLVEPVKSEVSGLKQRIVDAQTDHVETKKELQADIRRSLDMSGENKLRMNRVTHELKEEVALRMRICDMDVMQERMTKSMADVLRTCQNVKETAAMKLKQFIDHFMKIQEVVGDHEHVLRHHADELEDRGTKYDLLVCRASIERCVTRDEFVRDVVELKKAVTLNKEKLESLSVARARNCRPARRLKSGLAGKAARGIQQLIPNLISEDDQLEVGHLAEGEDDDVSIISDESLRDRRNRSRLTSDDWSKERRGHAAKRAELTSLGNDELRPNEARSEADAEAPVATGNAVQEDEAVDAKTFVKLARIARQETESQAEEMDEGESMESDDDAEDGGRIPTLVEALVLVVSGLSLLSLKEVRVRVSGAVRQRQEKELYAHVQALKSWILSKSKPEQWNRELLLGLVWAIERGGLPEGKPLAGKLLPQFSGAEKKKGWAKGANMDRRQSVTRRASLAQMLVSLSAKDTTPLSPRPPQASASTPSLNTSRRTPSEAKFAAGTPSNMLVLSSWAGLKTGPLPPLHPDGVGRFNTPRDVQVDFGRNRPL